MTRATVTNRFELQGSDERELARRVSMLREAVRAQKGRIVNVEWSRTTPTPTASVQYLLPLARLQADAS